MTVFTDKESARQHVWRKLSECGEDAITRPDELREGFVPNFTDAPRAAARLLDDPIFANVRRLKVNPDPAQSHVRAGALARGIEVIVRKPRLRDGYLHLRPGAIPESDRVPAASTALLEEWGEAVAIEDVPDFDLVVTGAVAVTPMGNRCGSGKANFDLEYAILRELGHGPVPVVTTVHPMQIIGEFPHDDFDVPLALMATPMQVVGVDIPLPSPSGIDWSLVTEETLRELPVLRDLKARRARGGRATSRSDTADRPSSSLG